MLMGWGGRYGVDVLTDPSSVSGTWCKIVAVGAVSSVNVVGNYYANNGSVTSPTSLADGQSMYGTFTAVTGTGVLWCYRQAGETVT